jgi:hypothetical protein
VGEIWIQKKGTKGIKMEMKELFYLEGEER